MRKQSNIIKQLNDERSLLQRKLENERVTSEKRIQALEREMGDIDVTLRVLETLERQKSAREISTQTMMALEDMHQDLLNRPSLSKMVNMVIGKLGQEITTARVYDEIKGLGVDLPMASPRTQISTALSRLHKRGNLVVVRQDGPGAPTVYRLSDQKDDL